MRPSLLMPAIIFFALSPLAEAIQCPFLNSEDATALMNQSWNASVQIEGHRWKLVKFSAFKSGGIAEELNLPNPSLQVILEGAAMPRYPSPPNCCVYDQGLRMSSNSPVYDGKNIYGFEIHLAD